MPITSPALLSRLTHASREAFVTITLAVDAFCFTVPYTVPQIAMTTETYQRIVNEFCQNPFNFSFTYLASELDVTPLEVSEALNRYAMYLAAITKNYTQRNTP